MEEEERSVIGRQEIPPELFAKLVRDYWGAYKRNFNRVLKLTSIYLLAIYLSIYALHFLSLTPFQYSYWFSFLVFFYPPLAIFLFAKYFYNILRMMGEGKCCEELPKRKILPSIMLIAFTSSISFSFTILHELFYAFGSWLLVIFVILFIQQLREELRTGKREFIPLLPKTDNLLKKIGRFFLVIISLIFTYSLLVFLPFYLSWYIDIKEWGVTFASFLAFILQLFIISTFSAMIAISVCLSVDLKEYIWFKPLSPLYKFLNKLFLPLIPLLFGAFAVFFTIILALGRDIPLNDSDLRLGKVEVPKKENAFYTFMEAYGKSRLPKDSKILADMLGKRDYKAIKKILRENEVVFPIIEKALKLPVFQSPQLQEPREYGFNTLFPEYSKLRKIAFLCALKAEYLFAEGKEREAFDCLFKAIKMGQMIEESPRPIFVTYLVGEACKEIGLREMRRLIPKTSLSSELLKSYAKALIRFQPSEAGIERGVKMEYIAVDNFLHKMEEASKSYAAFKELREETEWNNITKLLIWAMISKIDYKPNETRLIYAERVRKLISYVSKPYREADIKALKLPPPQKSLLEVNKIGKILLSIIMPHYENALLQHYYRKFSLEATATLLALRAYKKDKGHLPDNLSELVPEYLPEIPIDPFDGKPLRYSKEKRIIYCVGKDLIDSGGSIGERGSWKDWKDPTFPIPF